MGFTHGNFKINCRQQYEDEGLQNTNENAQAHEGNGQPKRQDRGEDQDHFVVTGHIPQKADGEGHRPHEVADQFNWEHQGSHQGHRANELLDVAGAVLTDSKSVGQQEDDDRKGKGDVELVGWWIESRDQSGEVQEQDEEPIGSEQGKQGSWSDTVLNNAREKIEDTLDNGDSKMIFV